MKMSHMHYVIMIMLCLVPMTGLGMEEEPWQQVRSRKKKKPKKPQCERREEQEQPKQPQRFKKKAKEKRQERQPDLKELGYQLIKAVGKRKQQDAKRLLPFFKGKPLPVSQKGKCLLCVAAGSGSPKMLELVVEHRCGDDKQHIADFINGSPCTVDQLYPLHWAALEERGTGAMRWLLQHDARLTVLDIHRRSALHMATERGRLDKIKVLVEAGATKLITVPDADRKTPLDYATERDLKIAAYLLVQSIRADNVGEEKLEKIIRVVAMQIGSKFAVSALNS